MAENVKPSASSSSPAVCNLRDPSESWDGLRQGMLYRGGCQPLALRGRRRALPPGVRTVVDLRYEHERLRYPMLWPDAGTDGLLVLRSAIEHLAPHEAMFEAVRDGRTAIRRAYGKLYAGLPFAADYRDLFVRACDRIAGADGPSLIHCSAGKDRTGMLVAIILDLIGAPREAVLADYMLSRSDEVLSNMRVDLAAAATARGAADPLEAAATLIDVEEGYLDAMFEEIEVRCGSTERYLIEGGLGVDAIILLRSTLSGQSALRNP